MREYEITYLISDVLGESEITKVTGRFAGLITHYKGEVLKEETWGRRKLAYPIKKQTFATYITVNFKMEGAGIKPLERDLYLDKDIIRHLLILKEFGKEKLELTAEDIAKTSDIEKVVGGEKSFEAVEGQTEDSYELMSKRDDSKESTTLTENADLDAEKDKEEVAEEAKVEIKPKATRTVKKTDKAVKEEILKEMQDSIAPKEDADSDTEKIEKPKAKKTSKPKVEKNTEDEADRLAKLNQEIEDILGDDL